MSIFENRREQVLPVLDAAQMEVAKRFSSASPKTFAPGEAVFHLGEQHAPAWLVLKGEIAITRRDGLSREAQIASLGVGQFSGEMSELAGRRSLAAGHAGPEGCTALPFTADQIRALIIGSAEVGETLMRAFILRRVAMLQDGGAGSILIGQPGTPDLLRLENFLSRNGYPCKVLDVAVDEEARALVEKTGVQLDELPVMVCPNGTVLKRPSDSEAAMCLGMTPDIDAAKLHDVVVVGAGPRSPLVRRTSGRVGANRELSRLSHRHLGQGAGRPRLHPGAEVRRRNRHSPPGQISRLRWTQAQATRASAA
jgi:thioredoxin reductase (NADPH)